MSRSLRAIIGSPDRDESWLSLRAARAARRTGRIAVVWAAVWFSVGCADAPAEESPRDLSTPHGEAYRPTVGGSQGLVAANHPLAASAGFEVLLAGGNAVDAAIATGAVLGVVEPFMSGVGGVGWMNIYWAETGTVHILNFSGRAPRSLSADHFDMEEGMAPRSALTPLVPGSASAWARAQERFGTMNAPRLLESAIRIADEGFPITAYGAGFHDRHSYVFLDWDGVGADAWWDGRREPPQPGMRVRNPDLANLYRILAQDGFDAFYEGEVPQEIVSAYQEAGGVITEEDFRDYEATWESPLHITYRGYDVYNAPPNSSGGLAILQILKTLEGYDLREMEVNSADYIHHLVEAIKLAGADREEWSGDPDFMDVEIPLDDLLSEEHAAQQRARIDPLMAATEVTAGRLQPGTTHYSIADARGNLVSVTTTMGSFFGTGLVGGGTGVLLNNGVTWFELDPESPAYVEGGKRTRWNMAPTLIGHDGTPFIAMGTPGGPGIWQTQPQVITKLLDFGMDPQNAIESPRFRWQLHGTEVQAEGRIAPEVVSELERRGHSVHVVDSWTMAVGGMNVVKRDPASGLMWGGADPRRDGYVVGW